LLAPAEIEEFVTKCLDQIGNLVLGNGGRLVFADVPDRLHHADKVQVFGDAHGEVSVVVDPFLLGDLAVSVALSAFKAVKEIVENLLAGFSPIVNILVAADVEDGIDVLDADDARAVLVHDGERAGDHIAAASGEGLAESSHELVKGDVAILIDVVEFQKGLDLPDFGEDAESVQRLGELFFVELFVSVVIHLLENNSE